MKTFNKVDYSNYNYKITADIQQTNKTKYSPQWTVLTEQNNIIPIDYNYDSTKYNHLYQKIKKKIIDMKLNDKKKIQNLNYYKYELKRVPKPSIKSNMTIEEFMSKNSDYIPLKNLFEKKKNQ